MSLWSHPGGKCQFNRPPPPQLIFWLSKKKNGSLCSNNNSSFFFFLFFSFFFFFTYQKKKKKKQQQQQQQQQHGVQKYLSGLMMGICEHGKVMILELRKNNVRLESIIGKYRSKEWLYKICIVVSWIFAVGYLLMWMRCGKGKGLMYLTWDFLGSVGRECFPCLC